MTTTIETTRLADLCRRTADLIQEHGLAEGSRVDEKNRLCFLGAFGTVEYDNPWTGRYDSVNLVVQRMRDLGYMHQGRERHRTSFSTDLAQAAADWSNDQAHIGNAVSVINVLRDVADSFDSEA